MKQSKTEGLPFNYEMKLYENNWVKNTVMSLLAHWGKNGKKSMELMEWLSGKKSVTSRSISLPHKKECQCAHSSGANKHRK